MKEIPIGQIYNDLDDIHDRACGMIIRCSAILAVVSGDERMQQKPCHDLANSLWGVMELLSILQNELNESWASFRKLVPDHLEAQVAVFKAEAKAGEAS